MKVILPDILRPQLIPELNDDLWHPRLGMLGLVWYEICGGVFCYTKHV